MYEAGNLAYEPDFPECEGALDWASPAPSLARRVLLEETAITRQLSMQDKAKKVRRNLAIRRFKSLASLIVLIDHRRRRHHRHESQKAQLIAMSRAFVKENDDWEFCFIVQDTCWFAKEDGGCPLEKCIREKPVNEKPAEKK